ncbi:MAG: threonine synthase, partial [Oscillospiraceae bacterium]|nr:threonine synthase [Oscillospiraceae bacterium]
YDRNRPFYNTMSPSMDILISSNLERLLFACTNHDDQQVRQYMESLAANGRYEVSEPVKKLLSSTFAAGFCDDAATWTMIGRMWKEHHYLIDPHTAVAFHVLEEYRRESEDSTPTLVVSTASPFKFCDNVLSALGKKPQTGIDVIPQLSETAGVSAPPSLAALKDKTVRFHDSIQRDAMPGKVCAFLNGG